MEDKQIIDLYLKRDENAIRESDVKYGNYCRTVAMNILKNNEDSEECVSDIWFAAWRSIPPQIPQILKMYFAKLTRNISIDRYRSQTREKRGSGEIPVILDELAECIPDRSDTEQQIEANMLSSLINSFVEGLSDREKIFFLKRYFYSQKVRDIAVSFGVSENVVSVSLSRTRDKLKKLLTEEGFDV